MINIIPIATTKPKKAIKNPIIYPFSSIFNEILPLIIKKLSALPLALALKRFIVKLSSTAIIETNKESASRP